MKLIAKKFFKHSTFVYVSDALKKRCTRVENIKNVVQQIGSLRRAARFRCATLCQLYEHVYEVYTCADETGRSWLNKGCTDNIVCAALYFVCARHSSQIYSPAGITSFMLFRCSSCPYLFLFLSRSLLAPLYRRITLRREKRLPESNHSLSGVSLSLFSLDARRDVC